LLASDIAAVEVFEDNYPAFDLLCYMSTQWNVGMAGATGLKYEVAHHKLDRARLDPDEYEIRMQDLRIMEQEALKVMRERQKED
jgi:hypothetical protein